MREDEIDHDPFEFDQCWNCAGEGVVYNCFEEWACVDPEGGCDLCERRCDVCRPRPRDKELDAVLSDALAASPPPSEEQ